MSEEPAHPLVSALQRRAFQRQLERGRAALTPANLLAAVEGLEETKWRETRNNWGFSEGLGVPNPKLDEIESHHPHLSDRLREVFSYLLRLDPDASWRNVVWALVWVEEMKLVDRLRPLAEPVTDPTLTVEAVATALQSVRNWSDVAGWLNMPPSIQDSIRVSHSSDEETMRALADYIVQSLPGASWSLLAAALVHCEEAAALGAVSSHLQREDDPSLTLPSLLSVLEGVTKWHNLGVWMGVPRSKLEGIVSRSPSASKGVEKVVKEWLEGHPAPSWRGLARVLYMLRGVREHTALQRVYDKHLPAPTLDREMEHENREMEYAELVFGEPITQGASGAVCKGQWVVWEGKEVAIQQVSIPEKKRENDVLDLCELKHPHLLTLYGTASKPPLMYIVTELAQLGSLGKHIQENKNPPDPKLSLSWAVGVAKGMSYLHEKGVVHRELKSNNVWLTAAQVAKLSVFHLLEDATGHTVWTAPEVMKGVECTKRSDMFSFGVLLWELLTHQVPFEGCTAGQIQSSIVEGKRPSISVFTVFDMSKLIQNCWAGDPEVRPTFADVLLILENQESLSMQEHTHENRLVEVGDITLDERIGAGGFGTVFRGSVKGWEGEVAIKQISTDETSAREEKEIKTLCDLKHPNVITLYGTAFKHPYLYIITELAGLDSLHNYIQKSRGQPDMELSLHWAAGVARGMSYLHEKDVVHRDLKSANVLLTSKKTAKLCDFGVARQMDHTTQATQAGTIAWMAPEVIYEAAYSKKCDLFSYGTVLWELVTHEVPFEKLNSNFKKMKAITDGQMPPIPECVADYLTTLIQRCWDKEPKNRPPFTEILSILEAKGLQEGGPEEGTG